MSTTDPTPEYGQDDMAHPLPRTSIVDRIDWIVEVLPRGRGRNGRAGIEHVLVVLLDRLCDAIGEFPHVVLKLDLEVVDRVVASEGPHLLGEFRELVIQFGLFLRKAIEVGLLFRRQLSTA